MKLGVAINKLDIILKTSRIFLSEAPIEVDLVAPVGVNYFCALPDFYVMLAMMN